MKKLESLRHYLVQRIPGLVTDPDRLLTFIEDGQIKFHRGQHLSHQYTVPARIILTDYSGELDAVMLPLLQWLSHYEPDVNPDEAVRFQAELLGHHAWDLAIDVTLTERVVATVDCDSGRIDIDHRMPSYPIEPCPATHWKLFMRDAEAEASYTLIAEWGDG